MDLYGGEIGIVFGFVGLESDGSADEFHAGFVLAGFVDHVAEEMGGFCAAGPHGKVAAIEGLCLGVSCGPVVFFGRFQQLIDRRLCHEPANPF